MGNRKHCDLQHDRRVLLCAMRLGAVDASHLGPSELSPITFQFSHHHCIDVVSPAVAVAGSKGSKDG